MKTGNPLVEILRSWCQTLQGQIFSFTQATQLPVHLPPSRWTRDLLFCCCYFYSIVTLVVHVPSLGNWAEPHSGSLITPNFFLAQFSCISFCSLLSFLSPPFPFTSEHPLSLSAQGWLCHSWGCTSLLTAGRGTAGASPCSALAGGFGGSCRLSAGWPVRAGEVLQTPPGSEEGAGSAWPRGLAEVRKKKPQSSQGCAEGLGWKPWTLSAINVINKRNKIKF